MREYPSQISYVRYYTNHVEDISSFIDAASRVLSVKNQEHLGSMGRGGERERGGKVWWRHPHEGSRGKEREMTLPRVEGGTYF